MTPIFSYEINEIVLFCPDHCKRSCSIHVAATKQDTLGRVHMHTMESDATCLVLMNLFLTLFKNRY